MTEDEVREILKGEFTLDIPNFEKWNPPRKEKSFWIKLDCHWDQDVRVRPLNPTCQLLWIKLVSLVGTSRQPRVNLTLTSLQLRVNLKGTSLQPSLLKLWKSGLIELLKKERKKEEKAAFFLHPDLTPKNIEILEAEFGRDVLETTGKEAVFYWQGLDELRKRTTPLMTSIQRYLRNEKRKPKPTNPEDGLPKNIGDKLYHPPPEMEVEAL